jgi:hypothetical protein
VSAREWIRERGDGVPPALTAVLLERVTNEGDTRDRFVEAAAAQLSVVLRSRPMTRAQAVDLLAADAFATYAFEAAADDPESLARRADEAMQAFALQAESDDA